MTRIVQKSLKFCINSAHEQPGNGYGLSLMLAALVVEFVNAGYTQ